MDNFYANPHNFRFCPRCGSRLVLKSIQNVPRLQCSQCDFIFYQNPVPAVGAIIPNEKSVLLVKRRFEPAAGDWCLPAGFVEMGENLDEGLRREVKEETNLTINSADLFFACSAMDDPRHHVVLIIYLARSATGELKAGDDAIDARFFPIDQLPTNIAFSCHRYALDKYMKSL